MAIWFDVDAAISEAPVNVLPLVLTSDFTTIKADLAYNAGGMALQWNFVTAAGAMLQTSVTPTTGGNYDWAIQGNGMYSIEIPASGGASINNDTEGFGWFTGSATGVLPWRGPVIGFRAAGLNDALIDSAWSTTRGLAGTALPAAAADAAGGLPISDAGGLDLDTLLGGITTILNRIGAFTGSGVNTIIGFFKAIFSSDASTPSDIGGTYDPATMSLEAFQGNALSVSDITTGIFDASTAFGKTTRALVVGTIDDSALTPTETTFECSDITDAASDVWVGVGGQFAYNTTTATLRNIRFKITGYSKVGSNGRFVVTMRNGGALPAAPVDGDIVVLT